MTTTRRTALAMLGLGTATALGSETFTKPPEKPGQIQTVTDGYDKERYAKAFEQLANEIRRDAVDIESIKLSSALESNQIADIHELAIRFLYKPEV